jgi:hypothetical protein
MGGTMKLLNSFSLNMLAELPARPAFEELSLAEAREALDRGFESAVGHADTAAVFSDVLGIEVLTVRNTVTLKKGDAAIVGQYRGPRLPEGTKQLPSGATIQWVKVTV